MLQAPTILGLLQVLTYAFNNIDMHYKINSKDINGQLCARY